MARCDGCGSEFEAARADARFCSARCQKAARRASSDRVAASPDIISDKVASPDKDVSGLAVPAVRDNRSGSQIVSEIIAAAEGLDGPEVPAEPDAVAKLIGSGAVTLGPPESMPAQGKVPAGFGGVNHRNHEIFPHSHLWEKEAQAKGTRAPLSAACSGRWLCETCGTWFTAPRCAKHEDRLPRLVTA